MNRYAKPKSVDEALGLLAERDWRILAGGTDFYPALGASPLTHDVLDINGLSELDHISETGTEFVLGARASWTSLIRHDLPPAFDALKLAAREVGSVQIQNRATMAGNLCNASPAADGVPPLLVLDAKVELKSTQGSRILPMAEFILGNRQTARASAELLTAIRIPKASTKGRSGFGKLGARRYLVISIAMGAARIELDGEGNVAQAAIAVGSCSPVALRLPELEAELVGKRPGIELLSYLKAGHFAALLPIDDVRADAGYRLVAAREIVGRSLLMAAGLATTELAAA